MKTIHCKIQRKKLGETNYFEASFPKSQINSVQKFPLDRENTLEIMIQEAKARLAWEGETVIAHEVVECSPGKAFIDFHVHGEMTFDERNKIFSS